MSKGAFITGLSGLVLSHDEQRFLAEKRPFGVILFARNVENPQQVAALCADIRSCLGEDNAPIFIDQEGGRVQRLRQPYWSSYPSAAVLGKLYEHDQQLGVEATRLNSRLIGADLAGLGINAVCAPCVDISVPGAHDVIGDRAFSSHPDSVAVLGRASVAGYLSAGVLPVIKHIPGHGRSLADSHLELPRVTASANELAKSDFLPFHVAHDCPFAMTAHIVYEAIDAVHPATLSRDLIKTIIRTQLGFSGALMSDDLGMKALSGSLTELAKGCRNADIDLILHCNGMMDDMEAVALGAGQLDGEALARCQVALSYLRPAEPLHRGNAQARLVEMLRQVGGEQSFVAAATPPHEAAYV